MKLFEEKNTNNNRIQFDKKNSRPRDSDGRNNSNDSRLRACRNNDPTAYYGAAETGAMFVRFFVAPFVTQTRILPTCDSKLIQGKHVIPSFIRRKTRDYKPGEKMWFLHSYTGRHGIINRGGGNELAAHPVNEKFSNAPFLLVSAWTACEA